MSIKHRIISLVLAAALAGATGCAARSGPAGEVPEAPSPATPAATSSAEAVTAEGAPVEEAVITVRDFAYELPASVAPGATVTVINDGDAAHTVTAQGKGSFDAVVAGGDTTTFIAPEEPGEYPIACTYHSEMTGILLVE